MQRFLSRRRMASTLALAVAMACGAAHADILKVAPKDAMAVLKINHLSATNKKVSDLMAKLGVAALKPELADPMGALKKHMKITAGLNEEGDAGLVVMPYESWPKDEAERSKPENAPLVVLVPVSDFKAFVAGLPEVKTEGDVSTFVNGGKAIYVTSWGEYAAMSPNKAAVSAKGEGVAVNASAAKELEAKDVVLWANVPAIKGAVAPQIASHKQEILDKVDAALKDNPQLSKFAPVGRAFVSQLLAAGETFLNESAGATLSVNLTDAGTNLAVESEFAKGSYIGSWVSSVKSDLAGGSYTAGLPGGPYIFYGGSAIDGAAMSKLMTDFSAPIVKELAAADADVGGKAQKTLDSMKALFASTKQMNFGMLAPRGNPGEDSLVQVDYVIKGDTNAFKAAMKDYGDASTALMGGFGGADMPISMEYKAGARTVDGVTFDSLAMVTKDPKNPNEAQMLQGIKIVYGKNGFRYDVGGIDSTTAIAGMCLSDANVSKLVASAKAGSDELGKMPNVAQTTKALPEKPVAAFYFAADETARTALSYAKMFMGAGPNVQIPENLPPLGFSASADGTTVRGEMHVPTDTVSAFVAAAFQMMMGGGGGNGGL